MKKLSNAVIIAVIAALILATAVLALVGNGGFETGDFTSWAKSAFINNGFNASQGSGGSDLSVVVGPAAALSLSDSNTGGVLKYPAYGSYSARINSALSYDGGGFGKNANTITQNITAVLNPGDNKAHVRFTYSAAMVNPVDNPHTAEEKPYFRVRAINTTNANDVLYDFSSYVGEPGKNWQTGVSFGSGGDFWQYLDWTYVDLASSDAHPVAAGDNIRLEITAAGCSLGGHPGYVYVDEVTDGDIAGPSINATGPATGNAGSTITYTYTYKNGSASAATLNISITPPTNVTFTSDSDVNCSGTAPVACTFNNVAGGGTGSFTVTGNISGAAAGTTLAHGDYSIGATGFPTVGGQTVLTNIPVATLTLTASGPATVLPGGQYTYTFNYTTTAVANNAQIAFTLPGHTMYVSNTGGYTCTPSSGVVTCGLGTISANGSFNVTVAVDKLKKVSTPLTLTSTAYSISATSVSAVNGLATVTANTLTPFTDVPAGHWALDYVQSIWAYGVTYGCATASPLTVYCPEQAITRGEMSIFIERSIHGGSFNPGAPAITFTDTTSHFARYWIEALKSDGVTSGCGAGTTFCPDAGITRVEMSVFLLRGQSWPASHTPPASTGKWPDVPATHWGVKWADELGTSGISSGCGGGNFCPNNAVLRSEMAVLIQKTFHMPLPTP